MVKYLVTIEKGRGGWNKAVYTAFLAIKLPDGRKKLFKVKNSRQMYKTDSVPRFDGEFYLTRTHMKTLYRETKPQHWNMRSLSSFDGMVDMVTPSRDKSWGRPVRFKMVIDDLRMGYYYNWKEKGGYIHVWSNALGAYDLKPRFPMKLLDTIPAKEKRKAQRTKGKISIPRLGTVKEWNLFMMYPDDRIFRGNTIQRVLHAVKKAKQGNPTPAELKRIENRETHALKEKKKLEDVMTTINKRKKRKK
jgi:hypothetical protein